MTTEAEARIREALEKAPTHGEWVAYRTGGRPEVSHAIPPFIAACNPTNIAALLAEIDRLTRERDEARVGLSKANEQAEHFEREWYLRGDEIERLRAERDALRDVLLRHGFVPCDIPACNCGSWHARFGYPERLREIADALDEAGHPLSNENGNMPLNALRELIAERDALAKQGETFRCLVDACKLLSSEAEEYEFDDGMGRGAMLDYWYEFDRKLDAALAQIEQERSEQAREGA